MRLEDLGNGVWANLAGQVRDQAGQQAPVDTTIVGDAGNDTVIGSLGCRLSCGKRCHRHSRSISAAVAIASVLATTIYKLMLIPSRPMRERLQRQTD